VDRVIASLDPTRTTLGLFLDSLIKAYNGACGVEISKRGCTVLEGTRMLYDEDFDMNSEKLLAELDCGDSRFIRVDFWDANVPLLVAIDKFDGMQFSFNLLPKRQSSKRKLEDDEVGQGESEDTVKNESEDAGKHEDEDEDEDVTQPPTKMSRLLIADRDVFII
jgi:hypothetical protein